MIPGEFETELAQSCELNLRPVTELDSDFVKRLYRSTREAELAFVPWTDEQKTAFVDMQFAAQCSHYKVEYPLADHCLVMSQGEAFARIYVDFSRDRIELLDLILDEQWRNRGIGARIVRAVQNEAQRGNRIVQIYLTSEDRALPFFVRFGFKPVEQQDFHIRFEWNPNYGGADK